MARGNNVRLTDRFVERVKPGRERRLYFDSIIGGLILVVYPNGKRCWFHGDRYAGEKHWHKRKIGEWLPVHSTQSMAHIVQNEPLTARNDSAPSLALDVDAARQTVLQRRGLLRQGVDPDAAIKAQAALRRAEMAKAEANLLAPLWKQFLNASTIKNLQERKRSGEGFCTLWGDRPVADVQPVEVRQHIVQVRDVHGRSEAAHRKAHLSVFYRWLIGNGLGNVTSNPVSVLSDKAMAIGNRVGERILEDAELKAVWHAAGELPGGGAALYGIGIRMLMLTACRFSEVFEAEWAEFDFEREIWTIPAPRMKMGKPHHLPITDSMLEVLQSIPRLANSPYVFTLDGRKPINGNGRWFEQLKQRSGVENWTPHDIRRTCRTRFSAIGGVDDVVKERALAHLPKDQVRRVYDKYDYAEEMRALFRAWEQRLFGIVCV
jgi:integrase